jgi:hypothetical protein
MLKVKFLGIPREGSTLTVSERVAEKTLLETKVHLDVTLKVANESAK